MRRLFFVSGLSAVGVLVAACGGTSPGVASLGSTTTITTAPAAQGTGLPPKGQIAVAFSQCMRSHGVPNFPMPVANAHGRVGITRTPAIANSPHFQPAQAHCRSLLPNGGGGPTITPADQADYSKGVACIRSHGYPDFPDPTISSNEVHFDVPRSIDPNSAQFRRAVETCEKLIPAGLPYSDNTGS